MKKKFGKIFIAAGILAFLAGGLYGAWNLYRGYRAGKLSNDILVVVDAAIDEAQSSDDTEEPAWKLFPDMQMPTVEKDGNKYIGKILIPDLDLDLPVMADWSYPKLDISPCRYKGSAYLDNMILMSHDYPQHFGRTYTLTQGAKATFIDVDGNVFEYELVNVEALYPTDIEILEQESDEYDLTIFACLYNGDMRTVGRFKRISD